MIKFKSATIWGAILWVSIFAIFSVIMFAPQLQGNQSMQTAIELIILPILTAFAAYMYFKGEKPNVKDGAVLGIYFVVFSTILDLVVTVPLFVKSYSTFYAQWSLWVGFLETIIFASLTGYYLSKKTAA